MAGKMVVRCTYISAGNTVSTFAGENYVTLIFSEIMTSVSLEGHNGYHNDQMEGLYVETVVRDEHFSFFS
jgi:hypothetical protein